MYALRSLTSLNTLSPLNPLCPLGTLNPGSSLRPLNALSPLNALGTLNPLSSLHTLGALCLRHGVNLIAIGNGTASRETDKLAADLIKLMAKGDAPAIDKVVVSEAGASVYSASEFASQEMPDVDVSLRGAASIARRLQDPLAELVKIDPKSIGVGQYQHDVNQSALAKSLESVVEDCVNAVGVDLNTASVPLLSRVSGLSGTVAKAVVRWREAHGAFSSRQDLLQVTGLDPSVSDPTLMGGGTMTMVDGRYFTAADAGADVMVVGQSLADANNLKVGDMVDIEGTQVEVIELNLAADFEDRYIEHLLLP